MKKVAIEKIATNFKVHNTKIFFRWSRNLTFGIKLNLASNDFHNFTIITEYEPFLKFDFHSLIIFTNRLNTNPHYNKPILNSQHSHSERNKHYIIYESTHTARLKTIQTAELPIRKIYAPKQKRHKTVRKLGTNSINYDVRHE